MSIGEVSLGLRLQVRHGKRQYFSMTKICAKINVAQQKRGTLRIYCQTILKLSKVHEQNLENCPNWA